MKTELYNCRIRLGGGEHELHDVPKLSVTRQHIMLFADIHGSDQIIDIAPVGIAEREHDEFMAELSAEFGPERVERVLNVKLQTVEAKMLQSGKEFVIPPVIVPAEANAAPVPASAVPAAEIAPKAAAPKEPKAKARPAEQSAEVAAVADNDGFE